MFLQDSISGVLASFYWYYSHLLDNMTPVFTTLFLVFCPSFFAGASIIYHIRQLDSCFSHYSGVLPCFLLAVDTILDTEPG